MMLIETDELSLTPGPLVLSEPLFSVNLKEIDEVDVHRIASALLSFPGVRQVQIDDYDWWKWCVRWEEGDRFIEIGMTVFEEGEIGDSWGGSPLKLRCSPGDLERLWSAVRGIKSTVLLHDGGDCRMYSPESFREEYVGAITAD